MTIELLAANWLAAKHTEDSARALRLDIEVQMLAQLPAVEEGVADAAVLDTVAEAEGCTEVDPPITVGVSDTAPEPCA